ncbi:hypothetical protein G6F23_014167 [Rhizopus arrhizus]|nr:hypothetical protein G6F23_014167 [Rhizopus arrhizus]
MASRSACLSAGKTASTFLRWFDEIFTRQTSALAPWLTAVPRMAATSTERPAAGCSIRRWRAWFWASIACRRSKTSMSGGGSEWDGQAPGVGAAHSA